MSQLHTVTCISPIFIPLVAIPHVHMYYFELNCKKKIWGVARSCVMCKRQWSALRHKNKLICQLAFETQLEFAQTLNIQSRPARIGLGHSALQAKGPGKNTRLFGVLGQNKTRFFTYVSQRAESKAATVTTSD